MFVRKNNNIQTKVASDVFGFSADEKCRLLISVVISVLGSCLFHFSRTVHAVYEDCDPLGTFHLEFLCVCSKLVLVSPYLRCLWQSTHIVAHGV